MAIPITAVRWLVNEEQRAQARWFMDCIEVALWLGDEERADSLHQAWANWYLGVKCVA